MTQEINQSKSELLEKIKKLESKVEKLEESKQGFKQQTKVFLSILNSIEEGIIVLDKKQNVLLINPKAEKILGQQSEDNFINDLSVKFNLLEAVNRKEFLKENFPHLKALEGETIFDKEIIFVNKTNNESKFISTTASPMKDLENNINGSVAVFRDITEKKEALLKLKEYSEDLEKKVAERTEELLKSNQELENFAYSASHDLQAPLRAITSYSEILLDELPDSLNEEQKMIFERIIKSTHRMKSLIDDLLEYSRVGQKNNNFSQFDINDSLKEVLINLKPVISEKEAKIESSDLPQEIYGNEILLSQILQNIISNSIKYNKTKPIIKINYFNENGNHIFSIEDNGIGILEKNLHQVFGIFKRLHSNSEYEGNGIGLAICKKIIEAHNGEISVESEFGKGSKFIFSIPIKNNH